MIGEQTQNEAPSVPEMPAAQNEETKESRIKKILLKAWPWAALVLAAVVYYFFYVHNSVLTLAQAKTKAEEFINKNLVQPGITASISQVVEESGLYKISLKVGSQDYTSFMTRDGSKFFTDAIDMTSTATSTPSQPASVISKTDKPEVKLFVMSYCPYGLQMEKGILPVINLLGQKINFNLEFVSYAMHGEKEVNENLAQYCIQKEEPAKLADYLSCFTASGDEAGCLKSQKIDTAKLAACTSSTDAQFKIKESLADQSLWVGGQYPPFDINKDDNEKYGVSGSPTLVINGTVVDSAPRDAAGLLEIACSSFNNQPQECTTELSATAPSAGIGEGTGTASNSSCGN